MKSTPVFLFLISMLACNQEKISPPIVSNTTVIAKTFEDKLSEAAISIVDPTIEYDPSYFAIKYPNGDIPKNKGVCTDVIIRAYRKLGIDLQKEVHEDMKAHFLQYPNLKKWGLRKTDTNIDHRGVPNLEFFFERKGGEITHFWKCKRLQKWRNRDLANCRRTTPYWYSNQQKIKRWATKSYCS
jgi:uncharacterized protein YijF (DUF1287 family)